MWNIIGFLVSHEIMMIVKQTIDRKRLYAEAEISARSVGKPFLVVGHPKDRHGCGDINVDIANGEISKCPTFIKADIEDLGIFKDKQFGSVFVGHVLEHVDDIEKAYLELCRVADKVFVAYPDWYSLTAYFSAGHKWLILSAPPNTDYIKYRKIS